MKKTVLKEGFIREFDTSKEAFDFMFKNQKNIQKDCRIGVSVKMPWTVRVSLKQSCEPEAKKSQASWKRVELAGRAADRALFKSPINGEIIDSHWKRNEHMKRQNVREVDNTEFKPCYRNAAFRKKYNIPESRAGDPLLQVDRKVDKIPEHIERTLYQKLAQS